MIRGGRALTSLLIVGAVAILGPACSDDEKTRTTSTDRPESTSSGHSTSITSAPGHALSVSVRNGKVQGGARRERIEVGELVNITVTSDIAEELHLHGYDITLDLEPGTAGSIRFTADIPGVFEAELERSGLKVLELEVS